jgi:hypothetical protein
MSEQMSAKELAHEIRVGTMADPYDLWIANVAALILADRKATIKRCKEEVALELAGNKTDTSTIRVALAALDAVLEGKPC